MKATDLYAYPDVSVVCGTPEFEDERRDTLINPVVLVEVLSPATAAYDRGEKFRRYPQIPMLQHYVLIAQDKIHIEHYERQDTGEWLRTDIHDLNATIDLTAIQIALAVTDVYEKVALM